ncbi:PHP domain-containing protein [Roseiflexus sp.]|uniref:PHP domain-containing protein n=1 Tax=Roseiflexus sp. TaxID=2562120 RepID=UPI00398AB6D9
MNQLPFRKPGRFYRGNLHTHSTVSDGELSPDDVVAAYRSQGYDFLALTDHFLPQYDFRITDTRAFRNAQFTTLLGAELHAPQTSAGRLWHIVAVGLPLDFAPTAPDETGPALAVRAAAAGAFVGIAHPAWYTLTLDDGLSIDAAHAVEVFNATAVWDNDRGDGWYLCDLLLRQGKRVLAYAADDAHFYIRPDTFVAWIQARAEELSPEAILEALKSGAFYSSQGPQIDDVDIDDRRVAVRCTPARAVFVSGPDERSGRCLGQAMTECEVPFQWLRDLPYIRVTVVDDAGRKAWTNPIWLK